MRDNRDPTRSIAGGLDIHLVFKPVDGPEARALQTQFVGFLRRRGVPFERALVFDAPVGPWPTPMWQVLLPPSSRVLQDLGVCIGWLMLNRGRFSVMVHPNTRREEGRGGMLEDHTDNTLWLGTPMLLRVETLTV